MLLITVTRSISSCPITKRVCCNCLKNIFVQWSFQVGLLFSTDDMCICLESPVRVLRGHPAGRKNVHITKLTSLVPFSVRLFMVFSVAFCRQLVMPFNCFGWYFLQFYWAGTTNNYCSSCKLNVCQKFQKPKFETNILCSWSTENFKSD